jgi:hypothetical protein
MDVCGAQADRLSEQASEDIHNTTELRSVAPVQCRVGAMV